MTNKILANFILHNEHIITLVDTPDGRFAKCETCSLSSAVAALVKLMYGHNVHSMMIDGTPVARI
jgi:hypothetical protein